MRLRMSMAGMLGVVMYAALILAALRSGSDGWFRATYTATAAALLVAVVVGRSRGSFWAGFGLVGLAYFALGFGPWIAAPAGAEGRGLNQNLVTSSLIEVASDAILARDPPPPGGGHDYFLARTSHKANLNGISHSAMTLLIACAGGLSARVAAAKGRLAGRSPA